MKKTFALLISAVMIVAVTATASAWTCDHIEVDGPLAVMVDEPFELCITVVDDAGLSVTDYDGTVTFNSTCSGVEMIDHATGNWTALEEVAYTFTGASNMGTQCFDVKFTSVNSGTCYIAVSGTNEVGDVDQFGEKKIAVIEPLKDTVGLTVDIVAPIDFRVAPGTMKFERVGEGACTDPQLLTLYNWGSKNLKITVDVTGEPFEEAVWIDGLGGDFYYWEVWNKTVNADLVTYQVEDYTEIKLCIPHEFGGTEGRYEGEITFWAEISM